MIDYSLKQKVDATFRLMDEVQNSDPKLTLSTGMTLREMLKYNLLQFIGFLFESDGTDGRLELARVPVSAAVRRQAQPQAGLLGRGGPGFRGVIRAGYAIQSA